MERLYFEVPGIGRKDDAIAYINEFYEYKSDINGVGGLHRFLDNYEGWLEKLEADYVRVPGEEKVPARTYFLVRESDRRIVGMINIRTVLNERLSKYGGHIGYSIRPTERGKGYNKINLYLGLKVLDRCRVRTAFLDADLDNPASWRTMEALGGERIREYYDDEDAHCVVVDYNIDVKKALAEHSEYEEMIMQPRGQQKKVRNIAIVSLSSGIIGEPFIRFEVEVGLRRLKEYGLNVKFMPHALKGLEYVRAHPEKRAEDLLAAFRDPEIDMILCAIGGDDTYKLLPYLFDHNELAEAVTDKIFLGFSDTTVNHLMLHKAGLKTFYGQAFLSDLCELGPEMHPYTRKYFEELIETGGIREIRPSDVWYGEREAFTPEQVGKQLPARPNQGFELLQGPPVFSGKILGGCIDSMYDFFNGDRYADMPVLCRKYHLFPDAEDWKGRILLLESSEEKPTPEAYRQALEYLKRTGVFGAVSGVLAGKPMDETYAEEYKQLLVEVIDRPELPIVFNLNIGHAMPRCIMPFGVEATVDAEKQVIRFAE